MARTGVDVVDDLAVLAAVRSSLVAEVVGWGTEVDMATLELLLSEMLTNAMEHGSPPIAVALDWDGDRLRAEISDGSPQVPVHRSPAPGDAGGRGVWLVARNATAWGVEPMPTGKSVWFELRA